MKPKFEIRATFNAPTYPLEDHTGMDWQLWRIGGLFRNERLVATYANENDAQIACDSANGTFSVPRMDNF